MKGIVFVLLAIIFIALASSYAQRILPKKLIPVSVKTTQAQSAKPTKHINLADTVSIFPLKKDNIYTLYSYIIDVRSESVVKKYKPLFTKHGYSFSGYVWMGILEDIIHACPDKEIAQNTFVKTQGDIVCFTITRYKAIAKFPRYICPILENPKRFERFIESADRNKIHNF